MSFHFFIPMQNPSLIKRAKREYDPKYDYYFNLTRLRDFEPNPWYDQWEMKLGRAEIVRQCGVVGMGYPNDDGSDRWNVFENYKGTIGRSRESRRLDPVPIPLNPHDAKAIAIMAPGCGQLGWFSARVGHWLYGFGYAGWELGLYYRKVEEGNDGYDHILFDLILRSPELGRLSEECRLYIGSEKEKKELAHRKKVGRG